MSLNVKCPDCGGPFEGKDWQAYTTVDCPVCGYRFTPLLTLASPVSDCIDEVVTRDNQGAYEVANQKHDGDWASQKKAKPYKRMGSQSKCPACGWRLDSDAYRCPKCFIYFCYKCRARISKGDSQYQCADQSCACYGKLLCAACTVMIAQNRDEQIKRTAGWKFVYLCLGLALITSIMVWRYFGFWPAALTAIVVSVGGIVTLAGTSLFREETVTETKLLGDHRCCIQCHHPVKTLT